MTRIKPTDPIPNVPFNTLSGISWPRPDAENRCFSLLVFYRGVQCSFCKTQLQSLLAWLPAFAQRNVDVIAISADSRERAQQAKTEWGLASLDLGYDLDVEAARQLGLYVSSAKRDAEMETFCEPGLFLVSPDNTLFAAWIQTYPHARPDFEDIIGCIDFIEEHKRPPRGDA